MENVKYPRVENPFEIRISRRIDGELRKHFHIHEEFPIERAIETLIDGSIEMISLESDEFLQLSNESLHEMAKLHDIYRAFEYKVFPRKQDIEWVENVLGIKHKEVSAFLENVLEIGAYRSFGVKLPHDDDGRMVT
ncbi:MAG: hypothetical protein ACFFCS_21595 [Candidatus Hodarchaeota archaeon]